MNRKSFIVLVIFLIVVFLSTGFWKWKEIKKAQVAEKQEQEQQPSQEKKQTFIVDVDPDVNHWQTKETEFFTIKFPKEWYWLESDPTKHGYPEDNSGREHVIANNSIFDIDKYMGIGRGTEDVPLILKDNTEIVISFYGTPTSNAGTAQQSIEFLIQGTKKNHAQATCEYLSDSKNIPIVAHCAFTNENHQKVQTYFVADEKNTIFFSVRTTEDNFVQKDILDKIAGSIILK